MTRTTYCPRLWTSVFIDYDGNVYSCCHHKPGVIGNIYDATLTEIYAGETLRQFQEQSLHGALRCYAGCTLLGEEDKTSRPGLGRLDTLKIRFGERCNVACTMCWQNHQSRQEIDAEKLIRNLGDLTPFASIDLQGGEPLFMRSAMKFFDHCIEQGKAASFLTNGTLMNEKLAEKIAKHVLQLYVSLNAATKKMHEEIVQGSTWERVLENIQMLRAARTRFETNLRIHGHMTIVRQNLHEIPLFIEKFQEFGFDEIDFGFDVSSVPLYLNIRFLFARTLRKAVQASLNASDISRIDTKRLKMLKLV